jgi:hypothetical protein
MMVFLDYLTLLLLAFLTVFAVGRGERLGVCALEDTWSAVGRAAGFCSCEAGAFLTRCATSCM